VPDNFLHITSTKIDNANNLVHGMKWNKVVPPIIGVIIVVLIVVVGSITPLVSILNPYRGVIQNSRNLVISNQTYNLPGLTNSVNVVQDSNGVYHIYAQSASDLYYSLGFIQAKNRLFQIEVFGLEGMGQMSTFFGQSYQNYDKFQTMTGAPITAEMDWANVYDNRSANVTDSTTSTALLSYAEGINAYINYSDAHNTLPLLFKLLGLKPYYWTPVYSFAVQELMTQTLEFGDSGLQFSLIYSMIGNATYDLIPTFSPVQSYYYAGYSGQANSSVMTESHDTYLPNATVISMTKILLKEFAYDPPTYFPVNVPDHSNEIVIAGNRTSTGNPILMGGPVLGFSLPSIWFQVQLVAPGIDAYGVVLPGDPAIVIGFNSNIAWTLTDTQAISDGTFFFVQQISGNSYYWNSTLHPLKIYKINGMDVNWTNLGPIMVENGSLAIVMDWMGNMFSDDLGALLNIMTSSNWNEFKSALSIWKAPYQNFAFANRTMIADISPAYYPIFSGTTYNPGSIMPGYGSEYISGSVPYNMVPQVVNPSDGFIVSSNQRQVGPAYPYWYGNTMSFSDGFRAMMEVNYLNNHTNISVHELSAFQQLNYTDYAAQQAVPKIMSYISSSSNTTLQRAAAIFSGWNYSMETSSTAASLWFFTYQYLFSDVFMPYLEQIGWIPANDKVLGVPSGMGGSLPNTTGYASFDVDLIHYILNGSAAPFTADNNTTMRGLVVMAVDQAMDHLLSIYPSGNFTWGKFYGFLFPNLFGLSSFNVGPISKGGDFNTPNDASGVGPSNYPTGGQSWVMVVNLSNVSRSIGVYPGGQSEDPASSQYSNYVSDWINGDYLPLLFAAKASDFSSANVMSVIQLNPQGA
jgi:penicillin amidase